MRPLERLELDVVAGGDVLESAEEAIAVPGDAGIPGGSRHRRVLDVAGAAVERAIVGSRQHGDLEPDPRDAEHRQRRRSRVLDGPAPGADALRGPQREVRRAGRRRQRLQRRESLEIVPRRARHPDVERPPPHQSDKTHGPARSLSDQQGPATSSHGSHHLLKDSVGIAGGVPHASEQGQAAGNHWGIGELTADPLLASQRRGPIRTEGPRNTVASTATGRATPEPPRLFIPPVFERPSQCAAGAERA